MINSSVALVRKLKDFFDRRIGLWAWQRVKITHFGQGEDDPYEFVGIEFAHQGRRFALQAVSPEDAPPLGKVELRQLGGDARVVGDLGEATFREVHEAITA